MENDFIWEAIKNLGGGVNSWLDENYSEIVFTDTPTFTEEEFKAELIKVQATHDNLKYQRDRASAFPSIGDQLDMQYWDEVNGTTTWKDAIAKVKADNPKGGE
tara:strand:- start:1433 stop:1741 length:309 start_codon:yes stop_codon:yes gene_type:complete